MISLSIARRLKEAGLSWTPAVNDYFALPDRGFDDHLFVISDVMSTIEIRQKLSVVTFQGTVEWALDYLLVSEVVWMPREDQLRENILTYLPDESQPTLRLEFTRGGYRCDIKIQGIWRTFEGTEASEAYAYALLYLLGEKE